MFNFMVYSIVLIVFLRVTGIGLLLMRLLGFSVETGIAKKVGQLGVILIGTACLVGLVVLLFNSAPDIFPFLGVGFLGLGIWGFFYALISHNTKNRHLGSEE